MDKKEIKIQLSDKHSLFTGFVSGLTDTDLLASKNKKWTAGQQLEHIYLSIKPLRQVLSLPKPFLKMLWGKANRKSKSYDALVEKYLVKLENGGRATGRFIPAPVSIKRVEKIKGKLISEVSVLCSRIEKFTEPELDQYLLPHPLVGKLTLREMMFFTIYHVEHHQKLTKQNLL